MPPLSLLSIVLYCSSQLRLSSMLIHKYFIFLTLLITSLLRTRFGNSLPILFNFPQWPITINSLLLAFKLNLFILIQFDVFSSSFFKSVIRSLRFSDAIVTHVSSAYIFGVMSSKQFSKSLLYSKNSKGPKHEPCGISKAKLLPIGQVRSEPVVRSTLDAILS